MPNTADRFLNLVRIITRLREPDGCPWDMRQTPQTFKTYIIEEAHELMEAIDCDNAGMVREELGDLLFQLIFVSNLYQENNSFTLAEVIDTISAKMIRRHPHVFGDSRIDSEESLRRQWHRIKEEEKGAEAAPASQLRSIPRSLPALRRAHRVSERVARMGFCLDDAAECVPDLGDRVAGAASAGRQTASGEDVFGDLLFALTVVAGKQGVNLEDALQQTIDRVIANADSAPQPAGNGLPPASGQVIGSLRDLLAAGKKH